MPRQITQLRVFASSPSDVSREREVLENVVRELNAGWAQDDNLILELIRWETHVHPAIGVDAQTVINDQIGDDYDIFIGIMWKRFGTPTGRAGSGTEEEFLRAYQRYVDVPDSISIMFYFSNNSIPPSEIDPDQLALVQRFKQRLPEMGVLYHGYSTLNEFEHLVRLHLIQVARQWRGAGHVSEVEATDTVTEVATETTQTIDEQMVDAHEEGYLDLALTATDEMETAQEIVVRMASHITALGDAVRTRTQELNEVNAPAVNARESKRIINRLADEMLRFNERIATEIPMFKYSYSKAMNAYAGAAALLEDFGDSHRDTAENAYRTVDGLAEALVTARDQLRHLCDVISTTPRLTTAFNHAKRDTVAILDSLITEYESAENLAREAQRVFMEIMEDNNQEGE